MRKMILSSVAAVIVFSSTLPSLAVASCDVAKPTALATTQATYGWRLAGKYRSYAAACRKPTRRLNKRFAAMVGGSAALHLLAVASAPARSLFRIAGGASIALTCSAIGMAVPLYAAWRREADREITRRPATPHPSAPVAPVEKEKP